MKDFLLYLVKKIVDHPDEVEIEETDVPEGISNYKIKTNQEDIGKVIGKDGKIIQSIRNVAKILAIKENKQIHIEIS